MPSTNLVPPDWWKETCIKTHQPLACVSLDNKFIWVNLAFEKLIGYSLAELREKTWMDITVQEDVGGDSASVRDVINGVADSYQISKRYKHKFGNVIPINLSVWRYPQTGGVPECFIVEASQKMASQAELLDLREELIKRIDRMSQDNREDRDNSSVEVNVGDRSSNSDRIMIAMAGVIAVVAVTLIWIAYYVFSKYGQVAPPNPYPPIHQTAPASGHISQ